MTAEYLQFDFFENPSELDELREELNVTRQALDNTRRGLFARYNDLSKLYVKQQQEIDHLRSMLIKEK